jgi:hypothetical protein
VDAEAELEAATSLTAVKAAAKKVMRAKAELKAVEQGSAKRPKPRSTRAGLLADAAS